MTKRVYVIFITHCGKKYTCGVISDLSIESRRKLMNYIENQTSFRFSGLLSLDFNIGLHPKVQADNDANAHLAVYRERCFE